LSTTLCNFDSAGLDSAVINGSRLVIIYIGALIYIHACIITLMYRAFFHGSTSLLGVKELWQARAPPRVKFFFWLVLCTTVYGPRIGESGMTSGTKTLVLSMPRIRKLLGTFFSNVCSRDRCGLCSCSRCSSTRFYHRLVAT
jgi:hypothetical protein